MKTDVKVENSLLTVGWGGYAASSAIAIVTELLNSLSPISLTAKILNS
jgi:hypothetical protein